MAKSEIKPGHWYLCVQCRSCQMAIPLVEILKDAPIGGDGDFTFTSVPCFYCGEKHDYKISEGKRVQAQSMPQDEN